jgi:hypothetical protein
MIRMMQDVDMKLNPGLPSKRSVQQEEESFHQQMQHKFKEETSEVLYIPYTYHCMVVKHGHFEK